MFRQRAKQAGLSDRKLTPHTMRHGLAVDLLEGGGVCHLCVDRIYRQETERAHAGGNLATALHLERERLSMRRDLARGRRVARTLRREAHLHDPVAAGH
jgi:hypothetical protein